MTRRLLLSCNLQHVLCVVDVPELQAGMVIKNMECSVLEAQQGTMSAGRHTWIAGVLLAISGIACMTNSNYWRMPSATSAKQAQQA